MTDAELSKIDTEAMQYADEQGGAYLMKLGKYDIRDLNEHESMKFVSIIVTTFNDHRSSALGNEAPF